ncbi:hypothetical protein Tco_0654765 [Tanacetum coccineum]|uniref:Uncharacterized protein n=1 Tax=Tanacetum coccineum TaxID=301880 RepID=A0ABQ4X442_9ASTR
MISPHSYCTAIRPTHNSWVYRNLMSLGLRGAHAVLDQMDTRLLGDACKYWEWGGGQTESLSHMCTLLSEELVISSDLSLGDYSTHSIIIWGYEAHECYIDGGGDRVEIEILSEIEVGVGLIWEDYLHILRSVYDALVDSGGRIVVYAASGLFLIIVGSEVGHHILVVELCNWGGLYDQRDVKDWEW